MTDFNTHRRALEAAAEAISDSLTMLGVDPDDRGDQGEDYGYVYSEDVKTIIAGAAIKAYKTTLDDIALKKELGQYRRLRPGLTVDGYTWTGDAWTLRIKS